MPLIGNKNYPDAGEPTAYRKDLLRGEFSLSEHGDTLTGQRSFHLILLSQEPDLKLVLTGDELLYLLYQRRGPLTIHIKQSSPGMGRLKGD